MQTINSTVDGYGSLYGDQYGMEKTGTEMLVLNGQNNNFYGITICDGDPTGPFRDGVAFAAAGSLGDGPVVADAGTGLTVGLLFAGGMPTRFPTPDWRSNPARRSTCKATASPFPARSLARGLDVGDSAGSGTLYLTNSYNNYSGGTILSNGTVAVGGTLYVAHPYSLGGGVIVVGRGGTVVL